MSSGPYLLHPSNAVTRVYRLYWDHNFAFVESVTEGPNGTFVPVTGLALTDAYGALSIAVPSRLYYPLPTEDKPLSGKRLGVKDIYDLKGVRTSGGRWLPASSRVVCGFRSWTRIIQLDGHCNCVGHGWICSPTSHGKWSFRHACH